MKFFEELRVGDRTELGGYTFTAEAIKEFGARFDPQPFHVDEAAARRSHFGALCASGWQTLAVWMRCLVLYRQAFDAERLARGEKVAANGPSPGIRDMRWLKPVYAGDTVSFAAEIVELRDLPARPEWGLMLTRCSGVNQRGETVIAFSGAEFIERRVPLAAQASAGTSGNS